MIARTLGLLCAEYVGSLVVRRPMREIAVAPVLLLALATTTVAAQKWPSIGTFAMPDGGTATVFMEFGNGLTRHRDYWTAKQKTLFSAPQKTASGDSYRSELDEYAYDCKGNRTALVSYTRYEGENLAGTIVDKLEPSTPSDYKWATTNTGSVLAVASKFVCGFAAMSSR
jgi:hypothetical protein